MVSDFEGTGRLVIKTSLTLVNDIILESSGSVMFPRPQINKCPGECYPLGEANHDLQWREFTAKSASCALLGCGLSSPTAGRWKTGLSQDSLGDSIDVPHPCVRGL